MDGIISNPALRTILHSRAFALKSTLQTEALGSDLLLYDDFPLHFPMSHTTELAAAKLEFTRFVGIELKSPWRFRLELDTAVLHRFEFKPVLLVGSFQTHAQQ